MSRFDTLAPDVRDSMVTPMHVILQGDAEKNEGTLYLGSLGAISDPDVLRAHHISHIIQVIELPWIPLDGFETYCIDLGDDQTADLQSHLADASLHIHGLIISGASVLVHCHQVSKT